MDFFRIATRKAKRGSILEVYPSFIIPTSRKSSDLMIRGSDFYAVWLEDRGVWSTDEGDVVEYVDRALDKYIEEEQPKHEEKLRALYMSISETKMIDNWHKYVRNQLRDSYHMLDEKLIFSNTKVTKKDYASKQLDYPLEEGDISAYDRLMSVLYSDEERRKIEWAIGSIVTGDSKKIQKFLVLYGSAGTGKSTVLNIIQQLFDGYYSVFDAKSLGMSNSMFALEAFRTNPLVAIQHDGDLSRIEDNTRLNSLVSHEIMTVNEKFKSTYSTRFKCFLFMGTNKPVKITDAKSGLIRRLIDVQPTGNKLSAKEYRMVMSKIQFELGAIAYHCQQVYLEDPSRYDDYIPERMMEASNDFYNFVLDSYHVFKEDNGVALKAAWEMYKAYCEDAKVAYPYSKKAFQEELKNYFLEVRDRHALEDGSRPRNYYYGFKTDIFETKNKEKEESTYTIKFDSTESVFDKVCSDYISQYAKADGSPTDYWDNVTTKLSDLDTSRLHYVLLPINHIVIDFDIPDENGNKSYEKNLEEASKWPATYAELSKSGAGIHLHYIYTGDPTKLMPLYKPHVEVKVFSGKQALRRKLSKCNSLPIATISSGLPTMKGEKMVDFEVIKNEKQIRKMIKKNLNKEYHASTKQSINFIADILDRAYRSGMHYDVSDLRPAVQAFANNSTNQARTCLKIFSEMHFASDDVRESVKESEESIVFFDCEVFPNLFLINWKFQGPNKKVVRMINPSPSEVSGLFQYKLVGFNCRRYDNHILYARVLGYNNEELYRLSQRIIDSKKGDKNCFFGEAYNVSYTDVYDFAATKQSLKKWEIELGIHHQELGLPWDKPVPEELWPKVAEYCDNDVIATEAVFDHLKGDFTARQILADVAGMSVNDTTNSLTTRIIFGSNRKPQSVFNYRNMGDIDAKDYSVHQIKPMDRSFGAVNPQWTVFDKLGRPIFPDYIYDHGKSIYRGEEVGEGGYVYAEPGIYTNIALLDIASMHPSSIVAEQLFGEEYTKRFQEILEARIAIKHGDFDKARKMLGGKLARYLEDESAAKDLAQALKIAINSVYGLTSASFENPFRDARNIDNIVAKRGALFMINLKHEVQARGFTVAHIKTDSIKIPNATPEIIDFVMEYGRLYGYNFEHEETYNRMCLVNDAVYIAKYDQPHYSKADKEKKHPIWWTATGTQFKVPYVFKTLFSHESLEFADFCETKSVTSSLYLDMNEGLPDVSALEKEMSNAESKYKKGLLSDLSFKEIADRLVPEIAKGHNYIFVGRVGSFCPIKKGHNGGLLMREKDGKYYAATGSSGYRWLEAERVVELDKENSIDEDYYISMANEAIKTINQYGDFDEFVNSETLNLLDIYMNKPAGDLNEEVPF